MSVTSNLDVTLAVNMDSGTSNVTPFAKPIRNHVQALAPVARRIAPPREMAV